VDNDVNNAVNNAVDGKIITTLNESKITSINTDYSKTELHPHKYEVK